MPNLEKKKAYQVNGNVLSQWCLILTLNILALNNLCSSRKNPLTYPMEGHWKFLGGRRVLKGKILQEKYKAKLEFPRVGGGGWKKILPGGSKDIFWNCTL